MRPIIRTAAAAAALALVSSGCSAAGDSEPTPTQTVTVTAQPSEEKSDTVVVSVGARWLPEGQDDVREMPARLSVSSNGKVIHKEDMALLPSSNSEEWLMREFEVLRGTEMTVIVQGQSNRMPSSAWVGCGIHAEDQVLSTEDSGDGPHLFSKCEVTVP